MDNVDVIDTIDNDMMSFDDFAIDFDSDVLLQDYDTADEEYQMELNQQINDCDIEFE